MGLVVDSSVLISAERGKLEWGRLVEHLAIESPFISAISLSELWHGCHRATGAYLPRRQSFVQSIENLMSVLPFGNGEALIHAKIWADLEKAGEKIGDHDLFIAATALSHGSPVATLNEREFGRVPSLRRVSLQRFLL